MKILNVLAVIALIACVSCGPTAMVQKDNHVDIRRYVSYAWVASSTKDTNQASSSTNDLQDRKIRETIDQNMLNIGFKLAKKNPDVLLTYELTVQKEKQDIRTPIYSNGGYRYVYNPYGRWIPVYYPSQIMGYRNSTQMVQERLFTISLIDAQTDKTIWQGWTSIDKNNTRLTDKEIEQNIKAIIKKLDN